MKTITICVDDSLYAYLEACSKNTGKSISALVSESISADFMKANVEQTWESMVRDMEEWKQERGFGLNAKRKSVSHSVCG